jgi:RNA polymerase sigma factor (sigma-70 family)
LQLKKSECAFGAGWNVELNLYRLLLLQKSFRISQELYQSFITAQPFCSQSMSMPETDQPLPESEQLLINGCMARDRASQARLYELYAPTMLGLCLRYAHRREEAEEILQEGFLRVFKYISTYRGEGPFGGWVRRIMVNCAITAMRNNVKMYPLASVAETLGDENADADVSGRIEKKELLALIQNLPPAYRLVLNLYVFEGYKHREIAELLHISEGTSKSNLSDARALLKEAILKHTQFLKYKECL